MEKCEHCGADLIKGGGPISEAGTVGGGQTMTDVPQSGVKSAHKELSKEIKGERERESLIESAEGVGEICPKCGMAGGVQTISDMPKLHLREAHRKLKEEIKEAKEKD